MIPLLILLLKYSIPILLLVLLSIHAKAQTQQTGWVLTANSPTTFGWSKQIAPADTSTMLVPYLKKVDTASLSDRVNTKLATAAFTGAAVISALAFTPYNATNPSGYITSASISGKLNISDSAAMLSPYLRNATAVATYGTITNLALKAPLASPSFTGTVSQSNATLSKQEYFIAPITTTNSTPVLIAQIPIPTNKTYYIEAYMMAVKSDGSTRNCGSITGLFSRVAGNLSQDGTLKNDLIGVLSTTKLTFVLNNTTHEVEIYANGLAATTINWDFMLNIMYKL